MAFLMSINFIFYSKYSFFLFFVLVQDVTARALGVQPTHLATAPKFLSSNLMMASIIMNIPSAAPTTPLSFTGASLSVPVTHPSLPASPFALANTLATGVFPAEHGMTACAWPNGASTSYAFSSADASVLPLVNNVADALLEAFPGALTLSLSADAKFAGAFAPRSTSGPNSVIASFDATTGGFATTGSNSMVANEFNRSNLLTAKSLAPLGVLVSGTTAYAGKIEFDLTNSVDAAFLAELAYFEAVSKVNTVSRTHAALTDASPDLLVFSYSALKPFLAGEASTATPRAEYALALVRAQAESIPARYAEVYSGRVLTTVNFLGTTTSIASHASKAVEIIKGAINREVSINADVFPLIQVSPPSPRSGMLGLAAPIDVCAEQEVVAALEKGGYAVACPSSYSPTPLFVQSSSLLLNDDDITPTPVSTNDVIVYQIVLWLCIGFFFVLYHIIDFLAFMDFKKDASLFGTINPVWTKGAGAHARSH